jgi:hypothetical protein
VINHKAIFSEHRANAFEIMEVVHLDVITVVDLKHVAPELVETAHTVGQNDRIGHFYFPFFNGIADGKSLQITMRAAAAKVAMPAVYGGSTRRNQSRRKHYLFSVISLFRVGSGRSRRRSLCAGREKPVSVERAAVEYEVGTTSGAEQGNGS